MKNAEIEQKKKIIDYRVNLKKAFFNIAEKGELRACELKEYMPFDFINFLVNNNYITTDSKMVFHAIPIPGTTKSRCHSECSYSLSLKGAALANRLADTTLQVLVESSLFSCNFGEQKKIIDDVTIGGMGLGYSTIINRDQLKQMLDEM
jgi:hypothetical protein